MIIQNSSNGLDNLILQLLKRNTQNNVASAQTPPIKPPPKINTQDIVSISENKNNIPSQNKGGLVSEKTTELENGFRRTQEFETPQGKKFTKIEEVTTTQDRTKRIVIQQNESGSTTALENILDRQDDGTFRLIQRYTDETGETKTNVQLNFNPLDANILLGRATSTPQQNINPFQSTRGTQVDLSV